MPICTGAERLKDETRRKVHPTQKPEALLARVHARRLQRRRRGARSVLRLRHHRAPWRSARPARSSASSGTTVYAEAARARIDAVEPLPRRRVAARANAAQRAARALPQRGRSRAGRAPARLWSTRGAATRRSVRADGALAARPGRRLDPQDRRAGAGAARLQRLDLLARRAARPTGRDRRFSSKCGRVGRDVAPVKRASHEEVPVDRPGGRGVDARRLHRGRRARRAGSPWRCRNGAAARACGAGPMPGISSSGLFDDLALALGAVGADGEAVRLVAQALDEIERRIARRQLEGVAARHEETFPARRRGRGPWRCRRAARPSTPSSASACRAASSWPVPPSMRTRSGQAGNCRRIVRRRRRASGSLPLACGRLRSVARRSFIRRAKRRGSTSRIMPKSSPGVRSSELMLKVR